MTFWVHVEADGLPWHLAELFEPPLPRVVAGRGYATFFVEFDDAVLRFASLDELRVCIETLSQKALPTSRVLSEKRGANYGPSNHWLNRFPLRMAWGYRQRVVKYLRVALAGFERELWR